LNGLGRRTDGALNGNEPHLSTLNVVTTMGLIDVTEGSARPRSGPSWTKDPLHGKRKHSVGEEPPHPLAGTVIISMVESARAAAVVPASGSATEARKRRKAIITQHRSDEPPSSSSPTVSSAPSPNSTLPSSDVAAQVLRDANNAPNETGDEDRSNVERTKRDENAGASSSRKADAENGNGDESGQRRRSDGGDECDNDGDGSESHDMGSDRDGFGGEENSKKRGQIRYDPEVPMRYVRSKRKSFSRQQTKPTSVDNQPHALPFSRVQQGAARHVAQGVSKGA
jgi:hypothetical protein